MLQSSKCSPGNITNISNLFLCLLAKRAVNIWQQKDTWSSSWSWTFVQLYWKNFYSLKNSKLSIRDRRHGVDCVWNRFNSTVWSCWSFRGLKYDTEGFRVHLIAVKEKLSHLWFFLQFFCKRRISIIFLFCLKRKSFVVVLHRVMWQDLNPALICMLLWEVMWLTHLDDSLSQSSQNLHTPRSYKDRNKC